MRNNSRDKSSVCYECLLEIIFLNIHLIKVEVSIKKLAMFYSL